MRVPHAVNIFQADLAVNIYCMVITFKAKLVMLGAALTNNSSEGFNSSWTQSLPAHASLFTVLETFIEVSMFNL
jgi:hypothetical protein